MADRSDIERLLKGLKRQQGIAPGAVRDIREAIDTCPV